MENNFLSALSVGAWKPKNERDDLKLKAVAENEWIWQFNLSMATIVSNHAAFVNNSVTQNGNSAAQNSSYPTQNHGSNCAHPPSIGQLCTQNPALLNPHPLQPDTTLKGSLKLIHDLNKSICTLTGFSASFPNCTNLSMAALACLLIINAHHKSKFPSKNTKIFANFDNIILVDPLFEHFNFQIHPLSLSSQNQICTDFLNTNVDKNTAAIFAHTDTKNIAQIAQIAQKNGAILCGHGTDFDATMGQSRYADLGFDIVFFGTKSSLFSGLNPICCKAELAAFLPNPSVQIDKKGIYFADYKKTAIGSLDTFFPNFLECIKAHAFLQSNGSNGIKKISENAKLIKEWGERKE